MSNAVPAPRPLAATERDFRLDFWRGLCLVDMVLVHLVHTGLKMGDVFTSIFGEVTRFAAGGFIFLAGLGVSYIFLPKANVPAKRWGAYKALWRRSLYLLFVHYAASLSFILIYPLHDYTGRYPSTWEYLYNIITFNEGCDLLIFYVAMVALSPALIEVVRRGYWWVAAFLSLSVFALGQYYAYDFALPIQDTFVIMLWQFIFIMGMLGGAILPKWDALAVRMKLKFALANLGLLAVIEALRWTSVGPALGITFVKSPLNYGEAARYLCLITNIMMWSDLAWRYIAQSEIVGFFRRLGRRSLAVYVAHVWVVAIVGSAARRTEWIGTWQMTYAAVAIAMLWAWTCVLDTLSAVPQKRGEEPWLGQAFWKVSGAAVAGVAFLFTIHAAMPTGHRDPAARILAKMSPTNLISEVADAPDADAFEPGPGPLPDMPNEDVTPDEAAA